MYSLRIAVLLFAAGIWFSYRACFPLTVIPFFHATGIFLIILLWFQAFIPAKALISLAPMRSLCLLFVAIFMLGSHRHHASRRLAPDHIAQALPVDMPVSVAGRIISINTQNDRNRLVLDAHKTYVDTQASSVQGRLLVRLHGVNTELAPGDIILLHGFMERVSGRRNPGDFDYASYLARQDIYTVLLANQFVILEKESSLSTFHSTRRNARNAIGSILSRHLAHPEARALMESLLLGETARIEEETLQAFRHTGLAHLLAISGLHMLCVGVIVYGLLRPLCLRAGLSWLISECLRTVLTLALLSVYLLVTGFRPSLIRAICMTAIVITAPLLQRPAATLNSLSLAGLILLIIRPAFLFEPGFQLSFSAVAGIVSIAPGLKSWIPLRIHSYPLGSYIVSSMSLSVSATVGTMFVTLLHFNTLAPGAILLNLLAIPLTTGILMSGMLMICVAPVSVVIAGLFGTCSEGLSILLLELARFSADLFPIVEGSLSYTPRIIYASLGIVVFLSALLKPRCNWTTACCVLLAISIGQWSQILKGKHHPALEILFFDVGHGDAALIRFPDYSAILVDTGDGTYPDPLQHLERFHRNCVDAIVLTHPHRDHITGVPRLGDTECTPIVYTNGSNRYVQSPLVGKNVSVTPLKAGDTLGKDTGVRIRVLSPGPTLIHHVDENDGSIVLLVEYGMTKMLFLGDTEAQAEGELLNNYRTLLAEPTIIKAGHHGSSTSSTSAFVSAVSSSKSPHMVIISSGEPGKYGLPDEEVISRWQSAGARVHNTYDSGAIWLRTDGTSIQEKHW